MQSASDQHNTLPIRLTQALIGGSMVQAVDAFDLHSYLEVGRRFPTWIDGRIAAYGFEEGRDYVKEVSPQTGKNPNGGRPAVNYMITLDMAKELAMVERNDRGKEARRYFIECERRALSQPFVSLPQPTDANWSAWLSLSTDERRTRQRDAMLYGKAYGAPGMRFAMVQVGMPSLPKHLMGAAEQHEMDLARPTMTVSVAIGGGA